MSEICKQTSGLLRDWVSTSLNLPPTVYTACLLSSGWLYLQWSHGPGITNIMGSPFWLKLHHQWTLLAALEKDSDFSKQWQDSTLWLILPFSTRTMWKNTLPTPAASLMCILGPLWTTASVCQPWGNIPQMVSLLCCCFINYNYN